MDDHSLCVSPDNLYDYLLRLGDARKTIRIVGNNALLMSFEATLGLLHTSHGEIWSAARQQKPSLPVHKTIAKLLDIPPKPIGRGTFLRLMRTASCPKIIRPLIEQAAQDYLWPRASMWIGFFSSSFFLHQTASEYWIRFTEEATVLNAEQMQCGESLLAQMTAYARAPVVIRFGCKLMRPELDARLAELHNVGLVIEDPVLQRVHVADQLTVLIRILAWKVADIVVDMWGMFERDAMENVTPLESILPRLDPSTQEWSNPIASALAQLAKRGGWQQKQKATTFLGNLWSQRDIFEKTESSSRIRLLRNWVQRKKGRPRFETLLSLANAVTFEQAILAGVKPEGHDEDAWLQAAILRVAETLAVLLHALITLGIAAEHITAIMDAYKEEYRHARQALGKPIEENGMQPS